MFVTLFKHSFECRVVCAMYQARVLFAWFVSESNEYNMVRESHML